MEARKQFTSNVFPAVKYSAANHFGGLSAHLLTADCVQRKYTTVSPSSPRGSELVALRSSLIAARPGTPAGGDGSSLIAHRGAGPSPAGLLSALRCRSSQRPGDLSPGRAAEGGLTVATTTTRSRASVRPGPARRRRGGDRDPWSDCSPRDSSRRWSSD